MNRSMEERKMKKWFAKELKIEKSEQMIKSDDYTEYLALEALEIPMSCRIDKPRIFFNQFPKLKCLSCDPELLKFFGKKDRLEIFIFPEKIKEIKKKHFEGLTRLQVIQLPVDVESIEEGCFDRMTHLESVKCKFSQLKLFNRKKLKTI